MPDETPLEAARRELLEETGLEGHFEAQKGGVDGTPPGFIGYEEHQAGSKGLHMNFCFVAEVSSFAVHPNEEYSEFCWADESDDIDCPKNVRELLRIALRI